MKKAIILFSFLSLLLTGCTIETNNKANNNIVDNSNDNNYIELVLNNIG